jgi:hypothetical protein
LKTYLFLTGFYSKKFRLSSEKQDTDFRHFQSKCPFPEMLFANLPKIKRNAKVRKLNNTGKTILIPKMLMWKNNFISISH